MPQTSLSLFNYAFVLVYGTLVLLQEKPLPTVQREPGIPRIPVMKNPGAGGGVLEIHYMQGQLPMRPSVSNILKMGPNVGSGSHYPDRILMYQNVFTKMSASRNWGTYRLRFFLFLLIHSAPVRLLYTLNFTEVQTDPY